MGRGASKNICLESANTALDNALLDINVDEIWLEDLVPKVIDEYQKISGHKVVNRNHYPRKRFQTIVSRHRLSKRGWECKKRYKTVYINVGDETVMHRSRKTKAFKIGE